MQRIDEDAARLRVSASEVIESHLTMYYEGSFLSERLERLENNLNVLMARVLPLVERVNGLLRQVEEQGGVSSGRQDAAEPPVKVASYAEMYGAGEPR
jgi:hypothetical protein